MILVLKLLLTPLLIALATLAGRRWGPAVSGWFTGFPLTSGPVSLILALQHGPAFASQAAVGNLGGLVSISAFCLAYAASARGTTFWISLVSGFGAYAAVTVAWSFFPLGLWPTVIVALGLNALALMLIPAGSAPMTAGTSTRWDLPLRMLIAAAFVFTLTTSATWMGPRLSGLLTPFPIFASTLAAFAHRQQGAAAAQRFLRGHVIGLFGFAAFLIAVAALLTQVPMAVTYPVAALAALIVNGITLRVT